MTAPEGDRMYEKVRALLALAERTDNPLEAEVFSAKAAELVDKYRLDVARLAPVGSGPNFTEERIDMRGFAALRASVQLLNAVAQHYAVTVLIGSTGNSKNPRLIGDADDIYTVRLLFASLVVQRDRAAHAETVPYGVHTTTFRTSFAYGYAGRINRRLKDLRAAQRSTARAEGDSTALVLFDRADAVAKYISGELAIKVHKSNLNAPTIDGASHRAGVRAADRADLGHTRTIGGTDQLALGR